MYNTRFQVVALFIWIMMFIYIIHKVKKKTIDIKYTLLWLLLDLSMIILTLLPSALTRMAMILGIETPSNMLFFFGIIFLLTIVFYLTVTVSKLNNEIKELSQAIAINSKESGKT